MTHGGKSGTDPVSVQRPFPTRPAEAGTETLERTASGCPGDELLFSLALGELDEASQAQAEEHVRSCADCREVLSEALRSLGGEAPPSEDTLRTRVLLDRYELREPIGSGGAGVVYRGYDPALKREVAVKILRPDLPGSREEFQIRLRREAQATAQLSHPNVVTAYDVGATDSGAFIVLEYFSGGTLEDWLNRPHPLQERIRVMCEAGRGLAAAHDKGLVHRDFKPQNVLMSEDGRVCVTDFGLARLQDTGHLKRFSMDSTIENATQTRGLMGTPNYMAPEVFEGVRGDEASDQFSFSVALYQAVNGRPPFRAASLTLAELLTRMKSGLIDPAEPGVPEHVSRVIQRGLSAEPSARFATMNDLLSALQERPQRLWIRYVALGAAASVAVVVGVISGLGETEPGEPVESVQSSAAETAVLSPTPEQASRNSAPANDEPPSEGVTATEPALIATAPTSPPTAVAPAPTTRPVVTKRSRPRPKAPQAKPESKAAEARFDDELRDPF